jgi:hypothetical protein
MGSGVKRDARRIRDNDPSIGIGETLLPLRH